MYAVKCCLIVRPKNLFSEAQPPIFCSVFFYVEDIDAWACIYNVYWRVWKLILVVSGLKKWKKDLCSARQTFSLNRQLKNNVSSLEKEGIFWLLSNYVIYMIFTWWEGCLPAVLLRNSWLYCWNMLYVIFLVHVPSISFAEIFVFYDLFK